MPFNVIFTTGLMQGFSTSAALCAVEMAAGAMPKTSRGISPVMHLPGSRRIEASPPSAGAVQEIGLVVEWEKRAIS